MHQPQRLALDLVFPSRLASWTVAFFWVLASGFAPVPRAWAQAPSPSGTVTTRLDLNLKELEEGLGADQRRELTRAGKLILEGKLVEADQLLDKVLAVFDERMKDAQLDYVSVANREQLNRYRTEHASTRKLIWIDWGYGQALLKKGVIAASGKRWKEAETWLEKAVRMRPYSAETFVERGFVLNKLGRSDEAAKSYDTALSLARTYPMEKVVEPAALRGLGFTRIELKDLPGARQAFQESLRVEPKNRLALNELRYIRDQERRRVMQRVGDLFQNGRWTDLASRLGQQVTAEPANAFGRFLRAYARAELGQWQQAVEDFEAAITLDDTDPGTWYYLTIAQLGAGQDKECRRTCERMFQRFGIDYGASIFMVRAYRGVPNALTDHTTVLAMAEALQKSLPRVADALSDLGGVLYRAGRFREAVQPLEEALKLRKPGEVSTYFDLIFLAMAHQRLEHQDEARRYLSDARKVLVQTETPGAKPLPWYVRVTTKRLGAEAEALLNPKPARSKP